MADCSHLKSYESNNGEYRVCYRCAAFLDQDRDGKTYDHERDFVRLNRQHRRVLTCMKDQGWWTLADLETATGDPQASISARIRDFRKERFGSHEVKRRRKGGTFEYRLVLKESV